MQSRHGAAGAVRWSTNTAVRPIEVLDRDDGAVVHANKSQLSQDSAHRPRAGASAPYRVI